MLLEAESAREQDVFDMLPPSLSTSFRRDYNLAKKIRCKDAYGAGEIIGETAGEASLTLALYGVGKGVTGVRRASAIKGAGKTFDANKLLKSGNQLDKGGELTKAGRALEKHGSRPGSIYPQATGNVANKNVLGNQTLESILNNPNATSVTRHHATLGDVLEIKIPGGMGARFSADGSTFIGFLE